MYYTPIKCKLENLTFNLDKIGVPDLHRLLGFGNLIVIEIILSRATI